MPLPDDFDWGGPFQCRRIRKLELELLSVEEKTWIARHVVDGSASASELSTWYGLNRKTITGWANTIRAGGVLEETVGRPHVSIQSPSNE